MPQDAKSRAFHAATSAWFAASFASPTAAQAEAWPAIQAGRHVLLAAPTGSGKTLAGFLAAIDALIVQALAGELDDATQVVYVSPLKALSNDIRRNLEMPLAGIRAALRDLGLPDVEIRSSVRTGDTTAGEREHMRRRPPHILVTTPESLYILLGSPSGRAMLTTTRTVIVDEIHALAANKRGAHLALSLERLEALCAEPPLRIGLSATQKPIATIARFLAGTDGASGRARPCTIIDAGHHRARDLDLEVPSSPLAAAMSADVWKEVYDRLAALIAAHRTTLVFVNTRRMAERVSHQLTTRLGDNQLTAHHGSLAKGQRLDAERRLQRGELKALVATASLELGIDVGEVDLVCQLGSPRSIASFVQRVGRSGHALHGMPKGRLFALSRDELVECAALIDSTKRGELDALQIPERPLDVLAQQIAAEVAARDWPQEELFALLRRAWPYRDLSREQYAAVLTMLAEGFAGGRGRRGAMIHHDAVHGVLRGRRGARLTALTSGGTIPDTADYRVLLEPEDLVIGTVNEDFAVESLAGDVFQLGNTAYRILRVERGVVRVEDARGAAPTIPFWLGEAPGRSDELSLSVSHLRAEIAARMESGGADGARRWLEEQLGIGAPAACQIVEYLGSGTAALGAMPTQQCLVLERFFDEAGGMQLVIHSPYGSRINRAWGMALRKRFCRKFNFELQAAATEDNIILSLTTAHSFELAEAARYLHSSSARSVLIQALLDAPMFITRWRWVAAVSLALPRYRGGKKVAPQIARMHAEDLIASVFPDQLACAENLAGEREVPDHPLVEQTIADCLHEAMDIRGLERLLAGLESGDIRLVARDLTEPSPLALEVLSARPYAFLDDAPLEERRAQAVIGRRWLDLETASDLGRLDPEAIARVRGEAWPDATNRDEAHDALLSLGFLTEAEAAASPDWRQWLTELERERRAGRATGPEGTLWIAAERLEQFAAFWPAARLPHGLSAPAALAARTWSHAEALVAVVRGRLEAVGPICVPALAAPLGLADAEILAALAALQAEGFAMRGHFTPGAGVEEWCERRLLARINRYTLKRLRAEIEPVAARDALRFLCAWQHADADIRMEGADALEALVGQLEGFQAPAGAWEREILPTRLAAYEPAWLDALCLAGAVTWRCLRPDGGPAGNARRPGPIRSTPIALLARAHAAAWTSIISKAAAAGLSAGAATVAEFIGRHGASFFAEIVAGTRLLRCQVEDAIAELVAVGLVSSDGFSGLRALLAPADQRRPGVRVRRRRVLAASMDAAGRWALTGNMAAAPQGNAVEYVARVLLRRYGVVFRRLLEREAPWLPPWRDLLRVYYRLESRGEVRGGRFVAGFSGEQFALPEALGALRQTRRREPNGSLVSVSAADPLNLLGILTPGARLPALTGNRLLYRDGVPLAVLAGGEVTYLQTLERASAWHVRNALLRSARPAPLPLRGAA